MRLVTFSDGGEPRLGVLRGENVLDLAKWAAVRDAKVPGSMLELIDSGAAGLGRLVALTGAEDGEIAAAGALLPLAEVQLLAPIPRTRQNIYAVGVNYAAHAQESNLARGGSGASAPTWATFFSKTPGTINRPGGPIVIDPAVTTEVDWEVELGVIIGRQGKNISREDALDYVFGYTVINDVSARDIQVRHGGQFFKGKSIDGYCPMGPCIVTPDELGDPQKLRLICRVNGEVKQDGNTADMIFDVAAIIAQLSIGTTLLPGDVIATGTPSGVGFARKPPEFLHVGDVVEVEVEGIGVVSNPVVAA